MMANCIIDGKAYGRELAQMWIAGYRAAQHERGIVECEDCIYLNRDDCECELFDFGFDGSGEYGFCAWGATSFADSSEDFSNWSLNEGRDDG